MNIKTGALLKAILIGVVISVVLTAVPAILFARSADPTQAFGSGLSIFGPGLALTCLSYSVPILFGILYVVFARRELVEMESMEFEQGLVGGGITGAAVGFISGVVSAIISFFTVNRILGEQFAGAGADEGMTTAIMIGSSLFSVCISVGLGAVLSGFSGGIFAALTGKKDS